MEASDAPSALPAESVDFSRFMLRLKASIAMSERERLLHERAAIHRSAADADAAKAATALAERERGTMARSPWRRNSMGISPAVTPSWRGWWS